jgi:hypothetical protein
MPSIPGRGTHRKNAGEASVLLAERLTTVQLDDALFGAQLVEGLKWAGEDAEHAEREAATRTPGWDHARAAAPWISAARRVTVDPGNVTDSQGRP